MTVEEESELNNNKKKEAPSKRNKGLNLPGTH